MVASHCFQSAPAAARWPAARCPPVRCTCTQDDFRACSYNLRARACSSFTLAHSAWSPPASVPLSSQPTLTGLHACCHPSRPRYDQALAYMPRFLCSHIRKYRPTRACGTVEPARTCSHPTILHAHPDLTPSGNLMHLLLLLPVCSATSAALTFAVLPIRPALGISWNDARMRTVISAFPPIPLAPLAIFCACFAHPHSAMPSHFLFSTYPSLFDVFRHAPRQLNLKPPTHSTRFESLCYHCSVNSLYVLFHKNAIAYKYKP